MYVIPAIDIIDGRCVRLTGGDYSKEKLYYNDPLDAAKAFEGAGLKRLHLVDLDGAKESKSKNLNILERIATHTALLIDFGGGIKSKDSLQSAFSSGASFVTCGSIAVKNRDEVLSWLSEYKDKLILGADCKDGKVAVSGWKEESCEEVIGFIKSYFDKGIEYSISTDIAKDGFLSGPSFSLYESILKETPKLKLIASGGISSLKDLKKLSALGLYGAIVGKAYYEGYLTLKELKEAEDAL